MFEFSNHITLGDLIAIGLLLAGIVVNYYGIMAQTPQELNPRRP